MFNKFSDVSGLCGSLHRSCVARVRLLVLYACLQAHVQVHKVPSSPCNASCFRGEPVAAVTIAFGPRLLLARPSASEELAHVPSFQIDPSLFPQFDKLLSSRIAAEQCAHCHISAPLLTKAMVKQDGALLLFQPKLCRSSRGAPQYTQQDEAGNRIRTHRSKLFP